MQTLEEKKRGWEAELAKRTAERVAKGAAWRERKIAERVAKAGAWRAKLAGKKQELIEKTPEKTLASLPKPQKIEKIEPVERIPEKIVKLKKVEKREKVSKPKRKVKVMKKVRVKKKKTKPKAIKKKIRMRKRIPKPKKKVALAKRAISLEKGKEILKEILKELPLVPKPIKKKVKKRRKKIKGKIKEAREKGTVETAMIVGPFTEISMPKGEKAFDWSTKRFEELEEKLKKLRRF